MTDWMKPRRVLSGSHAVKVGGPKVRAEPNEVPGGSGLRCNGCPKLSCIRQRKVTQPWRYYCAAKGRDVDPFTASKADCPLGREARRGRKPKGAVS